MDDELVKAQAGLKRMLKSKNMQHPEVIIIYAIKGQTAEMTGANWNGSVWRYSKWTQMPEPDLNGFLQVFLEANYRVVDVRAQAGDATPILVIRPDIEMRKAAKAATNLHLAIMNSD